MRLLVESRASPPVPPSYDHPADPVLVEYERSQSRQKPVALKQDLADTEFDTKGRIKT
jgi:hypothetical protein